MKENPLLFLSIVGIANVVVLAGVPLYHSLKGKEFTFQDWLGVFFGLLFGESLGILLLSK